METELKVLMVEDNPDDAELAERELRKAGFPIVLRRVQTKSDFLNALVEIPPDIILVDFTLPMFDGLSALSLTRQKYEDIPFIFVSGTIGEERAVNALKAGATDYVFKNNLARLVPSVRRALSEAQERRARRQAQLELYETKNRLDSMLSSLRDGVWSVCAQTGQVLYLNRAAEEIYARSLQEFPANMGLWEALVHIEDREFVSNARQEALLGRPIDIEYRICRPGGEVRWIHDRARLIYDADGKPSRIDGVVRDTTEQKKQEQRIIRFNRIYNLRSALNAMTLQVQDRQELFNEVCNIALKQGKFLLAWLGLLGPYVTQLKPVACKSADGIIGNKIMLRSASYTCEPDSPLSIAMRNNKVAVCNKLQTDLNFTLLRQEAMQLGADSAATLPFSLGNCALGVLVLYAENSNFFGEEERKLMGELAADISFALNYLEKKEQLNYLAYYDITTGLPNRTLFHELLNQAIQQADQEDFQIAVILINVERLRAITDTFGRHAADELTKLIAIRLCELAQPGNTVSHIGADRFAMLFTNIKTKNEVVTALKNILDVIVEPFNLEHHELRVAIRAGVSMYPNDGNEAETLLSQANIAANRAASVGGRYLFYAEEMDTKAAERFTIEAKLRTALEEEQFVLHYQPKFNLKTNRINGLEALIRWQDPKVGLVPPLNFISVLEETGMIIEVGKWVLSKAVADYKAWVKKGLAPPRISVNVSPIQLRHRDFVKEVKRRVKDLNVDQNPSIELEITEGVIMEDIEQSITKLKSIRQAGVRVAIDDFGTGYSSLSYIEKLPIDAVKIDRSFVANIINGSNTKTVVSTIISLARSLGLDVIAEGVELEEQSSMLRSLKCYEMQGFLFSGPVPATDIEHALGVNA